MNKDELYKQIKDLDWSKTKETQNQAINKLISDTTINSYDIIQVDLKCTWENAVSVLKEMGYPRNKNALPKLIWLLQDINWPGSMQSIEVIKEFDKSEIIMPIISAIKVAYKEKDYMWIGGLQLLVKATGIYNSILEIYPQIDSVFKLAEFI